MVSLLSRLKENAGPCLGRPGRIRRKKHDQQIITLEQSGRKLGAGPDRSRSAECAQRSDRPTLIESAFCRLVGGPS
jgi:hypothetical protein